MRINRITIENFQGARAIDLQLPTPLALIAGHNFQGKSSIAEAVRLAFLGSPERVGLKKEYGMLVSDGAKLGAVAIELEDGLVSFALPKGTAEGQDIIPNSVALPFVLAPERFAQADANERRNVLFTLTGAKIKPEDIANRLLARGCDAGLVTQIKPILRTGFGPGAEFAKQQATQAKGAWRAATGETYGEKKAEDWAADVPTFEHAELERASAELAALDARVEATAQSLGQITQRAAAYAAARDHIAARQARAARLPELQRKLEFDLAEHARAAAHVESLEARAGTGPRVGLVHDLARCLDDAYNIEDISFKLPAELDGRILKAFVAYEAQYGSLDAAGGDPEASAALPKAIEARDLMARSVENDRRDIAAAEEAAQEQAGDAAPEVIERSDVDAVRARLADLKAERKAADDRVQGLLNAKQAATSATERTTNAGRYHREVLAWSKIGDALAPDGIPGEILAEALQPVNDRLAHLSAEANWPAVAIGADMALTYGGRTYRLLSESERWRVDAIVGLALAIQSRLRCVILDRFDCLDPDGRGDLLGLLDTLAAAGELDTALVLGTLKTAPAAPTDLYTTHWIDNGTNAQTSLRAVARHKDDNMQNLGFFYDTETTGLPLFREPSEHPGQPHLVQLAAALVDLDTRETVASLDVVVRPDGWTIPDDVAAVHGITTDYAAAVGVPESLALSLFLEMWGGRLRIAHNEQFDARIIRIAQYRAGELDADLDRWKVGPTECTARLATPILQLPPTAKMVAAGRNHFKTANLGEAVEFFTGKPLENAHNAMAEVEGCMAVYFAIQDRQREA